MADLVNNGKRLPLTEDYLTPRGIQPLYVGDDVHFRFQVLDGNLDPVDITGYSIDALLTLGGTAVLRSTGAPIPGGTVDEIEIEAQSGTTLGFYRLNFASAAADVAALTPIIGRGRYTVTLTDTAGAVTTHVAGAIDVLQP